MPIDKLRVALLSAWHNGRPHGQCAVTALVVQDLFGGELMRGIVCGESHYWNRLPDGSEVDLTREQFQKFSVRDVVTRKREYVLSFPETVRRYEQIKAALHEHTCSEHGLLLPCSSCEAWMDDALGLPTQ